MEKDAKVRVMIADDHAIMCDGLQEVLERSGEFEVVAFASDGKEAVARAMESKPDVIIMDALMPVMDGVDSCREIVELLPETRVLILTASNNQSVIVRSVAAGATGYLQKYSGRDKLLSTVREVAQGDFRVQGEAARRLFDEMAGEAVSPPRSGLELLTVREREILRMYAQGMSYADIASVRGNKPMTVRNSVYEIQRKLKVKTKQELGVWTVRSGLLDEEEVA
jgi:two-component system NarL family response regulator